MIKKQDYIKKLEEQINNTLYALSIKRIIYTYLPINKKQNSNNEIIISWNNHEPGKFNTGKKFLQLEQYEKILKNNSYTCILYDGSIIRLSYKFKNNNLIGHNLLWWPAPYFYEGISIDEISPYDLFDEFIGEKDWHNILRMRSPVRIDFAPEQTSEIHSATHIHMQNENCRMVIDEPICFNRFIKFILDNYYPEIDFFFDESDNIKFEYENDFNNIQYSNSKIIL